MMSPSYSLGNTSVYSDLSETVSSSTTTTGSVTEENKSFSCTFCNKEFATKYRLEGHCRAELPDHNKLPLVEHKYLCVLCVAPYKGIDRPVPFAQLKTLETHRDSMHNGVHITKIERKSKTARKVQVQILGEVSVFEQLLEKDMERWKDNKPIMYSTGRAGANSPPSLSLSPITNPQTTTIKSPVTPGRSLGYTRSRKQNKTKITNPEKVSTGNVGSAKRIKLSDKDKDDDDDKVTVVCETQADALHQDVVEEDADIAGNPTQDEDGEADKIVGENSQFENEEKEEGETDAEESSSENRNGEDEDDDVVDMQEEEEEDMGTSQTDNASANDFCNMQKGESAKSNEAVPGTSFGNPVRGDNTKQIQQSKNQPSDSQNEDEDVDVMLPTQAPTSPLSCWEVIQPNLKMQSIAGTLKLYLQGKLTKIQLPVKPGSDCIVEEFSAKLGNSLATFYFIELLLRTRDIKELLDFYLLMEKNATADFQKSLFGMIQAFVIHKLHQEDGHLPAGLLIPPSLPPKNRRALLNDKHTREISKPNQPTFTAYDQFLLHNFKKMVIEIFVADANTQSSHYFSMMNLNCIQLLEEVLSNYVNGNFTTTFDCLFSTARNCPGFGTTKYLSFLGSDGFQRSVFVLPYVAEMNEIRKIPTPTTIMANGDDLELLLDFLYNGTYHDAVFEENKITLGFYRLLRTLRPNISFNDIISSTKGLLDLLEKSNDKVGILKILIEEENITFINAISQPIEALLTTPDRLTLLHSFSKEKVIFFLGQTSVQFVNEFDVYMMLLSWAFNSSNQEVPANLNVNVRDVSEAVKNQFRSVYRECLRMIDMIDYIAQMEKFGFIEEDVLNLTYVAYDQERADPSHKFLQTRKKNLLLPPGVC